MAPLHRVRETKRYVFLELPIGIIYFLCTIIETWIEEEFGGDVAIELQCERIFKFKLCTMIGCEPVDS